MLSQGTSAIKMRRHRAKLRASTPAQPRGRRTDYDRHRAFVAAVEAAKTKGDWALDRLVIREGYAHRDSLLKGYRWAQRALASEGRT